MAGAGKDLEFVGTAIMDMQAPNTSKLVHKRSMLLKTMDMHQPGTKIQDDIQN